ncbi:ATP-grasp fold amidoligase family protein [Salinigranum salinum]|uniref:ATP-grasp fold amidoligase family protein n=1 Tax=Salinigranum salinum TaxID=1364937 RepID=UPI00126124D8|nr:ATP-grasp fold amidoligase family protein [Salinigranum salinum]
MNRLASARELYAEGGSKTLAVWVADYLLTNHPVSPKLQSLLGAELHQQLWAYTKLGYWPDVREPRTFNEKVLHRKLFTDDDRFSTLEDKWAAREYVADRVGRDVLPEVYHSTDRPETIPFDSLPDGYVVKPTHLCGAIEIVDEEDDPDETALVRQCREWLDEVHGQLRAEYWYDDIEPRILVEERLHGQGPHVPLDYKLYVFHGHVAYVGVHVDRFAGQTVRYYDREWIPQEFSVAVEVGPEVDEPERFDEMISVAEELAKGLDFVRVDLYHVDGGRIVFGELTVAPGSGTLRFVPEEYDQEFGSYW